MKRRNTLCARNMKILVLALISISINFDKTLGQSWRKNDRIETFRTRQIIHNQFVCDDRDTTFELVTGYVFTAPDSILNTHSGMFHLEDCINKCSEDTKCLAVNYETGLCVLFSASADFNPDSLSPSQFPVFTMYATKICITNVKEECSFSQNPITTRVKKKKPNASVAPRKFGTGSLGNSDTYTYTRSWSFDRIHQHQLVGFVRKRFRVKTGREECLEHCLLEKKFTCRSANYNKGTRICELSDMDRHTTSSMSTIVPNANVDYFENNCLSFDAKQDENDDIKQGNNRNKNKIGMKEYEVVNKQKDKKHQELSCNFKATKGRILKTVDSVYQNVTTLEECRLKCVTANFRCYSYDYGDTGVNVCRLSHHAVSTLYLIDDPYIRSETAVTYERGACYNVTIECQSSFMVAHVRTNRVFSGRMYGRTRPNSCVVDIDRSLDFEIKLGYNDIDCDVSNTGAGRFSSEVVIQHHDTIVTSSDVGLRIRCNYNLTNRTVTHTSSLEVNDGTGNGLGEAAMQTTAVAAPNVTMRITLRDGNDITSAKVGDHLALRFEIEEAKSSPYEIFVRELVASDGVDTSEILLIDDRGCPTDYTIMNQVQEVNGNGQRLQANFDAFKFPTSDVVQFRALVTPCIPRCDPVQCDVTDYLGKQHNTKSYGRRRRKRSEGTNDNQRQNSRKMPKPVELKVASLIHISDKFDESSVLDDTVKKVIDKKHAVEDSFNGSYLSSNNLGTYSSSQDWEHQSQTFESSDDNQCDITHDEQCTNDMYTMAIGVTVFIIVQCILIAVWVLVYHKQKKISTGQEPIKHEEHANPWAKYQSWSLVNNKQNFIFDHLKSKTSVRQLKPPHLQNYPIESTYTDFDPYLPNARLNSSSCMDEMFQRKTPLRSTISTTIVGEQYNSLDLQNIENYRSPRDECTNRQQREKHDHGSRDFPHNNPNNDVITDERPMPFNYCKPTPFVNTKSVLKPDYQSSPMSSISSFNSSSEESHITNSTSLSFPHQHRKKYIAKSSGNNSLKGETQVKCAPLKPKRLSKCVTSKHNN